MLYQILGTGEGSHGSKPLSCTALHRVVDMRLSNYKKPDGGP